MPTPSSLDGLIDKVSVYLKKRQIKQIKAAFEFGRLAHQGQTRKTGGDYIWHPVAVAEILAEIQLDHESLIAAILHDVVEDTDYNKEDIVERFGENVAEIVDGVTKLGKLEFDNPQEAQAENFRKMVLAMSRDIRVILIKLADRLHNMRTLGVMRPDKQRRIARETLEIYAPIAARLGINAIRIELEDLGLRAMHPFRYAVLENAVKKARGNRAEVIKQINEAISHRLQSESIPAQVIGREKHLNSLYKKMKYKKLSFDEILDIFAFRVVVNTADECYRALGTVHSLYKPFPGRFKDYIAIPKSNGYQSLHTVLFGPFGAYIEIQIRTNEMHEVSEHGIAAHWAYKQDITTEGKKVERQLNAVEIRAQEWVKNLLEIQQGAGNSLDFLENVKIDLFPNVIYVFSPKGDIITLPAGSTAVDFAYAVHTNVGHGTVGCRVDKKLIPLRTRLETGQTVEIIRSKELQPNPSWLQFVTTAKARSQIRAFLKNQQSASAKSLGQRLLTKALRTFNMSYEGLTETIRQRITEEFKLPDWDHLLEEIGLGKRLANLVSKQIHDLVMGKEDTLNLQNMPENNAEPLVISGTEGMAVNYAGCCHPIPGDDIMGFISAEKGLVIHRQECKNVKQFKNHPEKWLDVSWEDNITQTFDVELQLEVRNTRGALATIASNIAEMKTDIDRVRSEDKDETYSLMNIVIHVHTRKHLADVMRKLKHLPIVEKIQRL
ncbi:MAG: bifunctional (p)ppGpp synthetase/guanosine-3',5'-bis(diphosphate) 3'-pyrophosphohydrolase [Thiomicrospira sp.]|nr:bifunctional (p)ppGpp synthetase/guanosine-3',5'-bis(diphosphate) 3'-pyrophosphohydrolase [Thiomicrospira sp.]OIP94394.1 MAG: bifunctional GTP diphosphokinase/guanosine-3',5'-bis(diphosphate) 3'-diphosphatase [Thiomicrospira sp. CG2_30_44_34]PIU39419.1 MAG: bifunctional GTP diphosphokinase/guanosine-3',5'-bis(diphosphate) 3'-diphosphatase [Piscirickettsiaceae bacterium CG07_land_8_20_14_0_80_44_28]